MIASAFNTREPLLTAPLPVAGWSAPLTDCGRHLADLTENPPAGSTRNELVRFSNQFHNCGMRHGISSTPQALFFLHMPICLRTRVSLQSIIHNSCSLGMPAGYAQKTLVLQRLPIIPTALRHAESA